MTNAFEQALLKTREFAAHESCQRNHVKKWASAFVCIQPCFAVTAFGDGLELLLPYG